MAPVAEGSEPWGALLQSAREYINTEPLQALQLCDRAALLGDEARRRAALLRGDILVKLGDYPGALSSYDSVADVAHKDWELDVARGLALFYMGRFAESESALGSALRDREDLAPAHFALGVMAEISGSGHEAEFFRRARKLDPVRFSAGCRLSSKEFEDIVQKALADLEPPLREALGSMLVLVTPMPRLEDLQHRDVAMTPLSHGARVAVAMDPEDDLLEPEHAQPALLLFKRNIERVCTNADEVLAAVTTLLVEEAKASEETGGTVVPLHDDGPKSV